MQPLTSSNHYRLEIALSNDKFRQVLESQTNIKLEDPELEKVIKEKFNASSFNPVQWLLDIEDESYSEREGKDAPWDVTWVFTDITKLEVDGNRIIIEGPANPSANKAAPMASMA